MKKIQLAACSCLIIASSFTGNYSRAIATDKENTTSKDADTPKDNTTDKENKDPDYIMDTSKIGESQNGFIRSDQLLELGSLTSGALSLEGEQSLKEGSIDRALTVLQRSVEMAPLDMDARTLYAQTLEKKLMMQKDQKDPALYNFIIKQWFFVFKKSDFLDQKMQGWSHLRDLTGTNPKTFERADKFLSRVLIPEDGSVKVPLGGSNNKSNTKKLADKANLEPDDALGKKDTVY